MRRQYHHHQTAQGMLIWDVHRLVELSRDLPVVEIPVEGIRELDQSFWFEDSERQASCRDVALHAKLIEEADLSFPIIRASDGRVMDGMHRVCKAWMRGQETVRAVQFKSDPEPDFVDVPLDQLCYDSPW